MGIADGLHLEDSVDERNIRDVKWLHVFDRYQSFSSDGTFEKDLNSPNYGYPIKLFGSQNAQLISSLPAQELE